MAQVGIRNSWSLVGFAKLFGPKVQLANFTNKQTGEQFASVVVTNSAGDRKLVGFSQNLPEMTPAQLSAQCGNLQVVELESGSYKLCKVGENTWEDVNLPL